MYKVASTLFFFWNRIKYFLIHRSIQFDIHYKKKTLTYICLKIIGLADIFKFCKTLHDKNKKSEYFLFLKMK